MSRQKIKQPRYVFWTSGWDSTYMVIKLLRDGYTVQPIYIINPKRKSRHHELLALQSLSRLISQRIKTGELLPYQTFDLRTVKTDPAITQAFTNIMDQLPEGQRPLGYQYCYLANFAKQHPEFPVIGIGLERALSPDQCACSALIFPLLTPPRLRWPKISNLGATKTLCNIFGFAINQLRECSVAFATLAPARLSVRWIFFCLHPPSLAIIKFNISSNVTVKSPKNSSVSFTVFADIGY